ncbi:MAG: Plug domain-containing protein [Burkholderiaceae bacterium]
MSRRSPFAHARTPVCAAALLALTGTAALAQSAPAAEPAEAPGKVQEIVISAQKRTERLKDTPVAAAVVSNELLEKANATDIADLNNLVPSVQLKGSFNGRVPMAMRGISTSANEAAIGLTSGVAVLIDGVPVPPDSTAANELQDVRRVEVLEGPQSTLGGRAALATGDGELVIKGKSFGTMPMQARLDAASARAGLKLLGVGKLAFLATLPFRKGGGR